MSSLARKLKAQILSRGPITFRDFMQSALYDPDAGYYNTERLKIGPSGDYYTSSNVHAAFGASLARLFSNLPELPEQIGPRGPAAVNPAPDEPYTVLEVGAGTGQLAYDILAALRVEHPKIYSRVRYLIVERSPAMQARLRERLGGYGDKVEWLGVKPDGHPRCSPIDGVIFSNELIDALPVHVVRAARGELEELYVTSADRSTAERPRSISSPAASPSTNSSESSMPLSRDFHFVWGALSSLRINDYVDRMDVPLSQGQVIEVNLDAIDWLKAVARILHVGHLVTIDYGDIAPHLYGHDRRSGTLRAFHRHRVASSLLDRIGEQDLTASVNFTALMDYGREAGLETLSYERQSAFLIRMGLIDKLARMDSASDAQAALKDRLAIKNLFVPGGSSDNFRVLIQRKISP